jgi:hypothetical protein
LLPLLLRIQSGSKRKQLNLIALSLSSITSDPNNIDAVTTLASMGILSGDESMVEAAFEEVSTLSPDRRKALDKNGDIDWLTVRNDLIKVKRSSFSPFSPTPGRHLEADWPFFAPCPIHLG